MRYIFLPAIVLLNTISTFGQDTTDREATELKHYMPLYLDAPAELNVRKGYKELNLAGGYADFKDFSGVRSLIEYDFAPVDKLGFEIELPFIFVNNKHTITANHEGEEDVIVPEEGGAAQSAMALRLGFNYTVATFKRAKTTLAAGYFHEFESAAFAHFGKPVLEGNVYNPFVIVAKVWGARLHSMIYTGPAIKQELEHHTTHTAYRFNTVLTYRYGQGQNDSYIGVECNQTWEKGVAGQLVLRPQVQMQLTQAWKMGLVAGIPVATANHLNSSGFLRLIYSLR